MYEGRDSLSMNVEKSLVFMKHRSAAFQTLISNHFLSLATLLGLRHCLTCHLLLEPFLGGFLLDVMGLSLAQNVLEPELGTLMVGLQMCHLSGVGTNAIALDITLLLGESDSSVEHASCETVLGAASVPRSVDQYLVYQCRVCSETYAF